MENGPTEAHTRKHLVVSRGLSCGGERIRTASLCVANAALSRLELRPRVRKKKNSSGAGTRTPNLSDMSRALWPVELRRPAGCGGRIRTDNLRVMSPTSFQLLHPAVSSAGSGSRTRTRIPSKDFKSLASASSAIPARLAHRLPGYAWSGKGDLNSRPLPWQGSALPLSYSRASGSHCIWEEKRLQLRRAGFEPARPWALAPKASASASSATLAIAARSVSCSKNPVKSKGPARQAHRSREDTPDQGTSSRVTPPAGRPHGAARLAGG